MARDHIPLGAERPTSPYDIETPGFRIDDLFSTHYYIYRLVNSDDERGSFFPEVVKPEPGYDFRSKPTLFVQVICHNVVDDGFRSRPRDYWYYQSFAVLMQTFAIINSIIDESSSLDDFTNIMTKKANENEDIEPGMIVMGMFAEVGDNIVKPSCYKTALRSMLDLLAQDVEDYIRSRSVRL